MDFVITVCDSPAGQACPLWPGHPSIAHWSIDDPAAVSGSDLDREQAFERAFQVLKTGISTFFHLPLASLDQFTMGTRLRAIGYMERAGVGLRNPYSYTVVNDRTVLVDPRTRQIVQVIK